MYDLLILGAGPAGLACSAYASQKRLKHLVLAQELGGRCNVPVSIPEMEDLSGIKSLEQVRIYRSRLECKTAPFRSENIRQLSQTSVQEGETTFEVRTRKPDGEEGSYQARTVLVATGTKLFRIRVPGIDKFWGKGLATNLQSYSHAFCEREVFIYGDSNRAILNALDLEGFATKVHLGLAPDGTYRMDYLESVRKSGKISVYEDAMILAFDGDEYCRHVDLLSQQERIRVRADGFFLEFEPEPALDFLDLELRPDMDERGRLIVDPYMQTSLPGLFSAGDVCNLGRQQVLTALGQGAAAAMSISQFLRNPEIWD